MLPNCQENYFFNPSLTAWSGFGHAGCSELSVAARYLFAKRTAVLVFRIGLSHLCINIETISFMRSLLCYSVSVNNVDVTYISSAKCKGPFSFFFFLGFFSYGSVMQTPKSLGTHEKPGRRASRLLTLGRYIIHTILI